MLERIKKNENCSSFFNLILLEFDLYLLQICNSNNSCTEFKTYDLKEEIIFFVSNKKVSTFCINLKLIYGYWYIFRSIFHNFGLSYLHLTSYQLKIFHYNCLIIGITWKLLIFKVHRRTLNFSLFFPPVSP